MTTTQRPTRVLAALAIVALTIAPAAGASETSDGRGSNPESIWSTALDFMAPFGDWLLGVVGFEDTTGSTAPGRVESGHTPSSTARSAEPPPSTTPPQPRRSHGHLDPIG